MVPFVVALTLNYDHPADSNVHGYLLYMLIVPYRSYTHRINVLQEVIYGITATKTPPIRFMNYMFLRDPWLLPGMIWTQCCGFGSNLILVFACVFKENVTLELTSYMTTSQLVSDWAWSSQWRLWCVRVYMLR